MRQLVCVLLLISLASAQTPAPITVIEVGSFHGDDVKSLALKDGEWWLGLFQDGQGYSWSRTPISVVASRDEIVDEDTGPVTGITVSARRKIEPLFLVHGLDELASHRIVTAAKDVVLDSGSDVPLTLNGTTYHLKVTGPKSKEQALGPGARATLTLGNVQQELYSLTRDANEPNWQLVWAGDLDGDGELDLYVDMGNHYNVSDKRLFVSSRAESGKLVRQVAEFITTGC